MELTLAVFIEASVFLRRATLFVSRRRDPVTKTASFSNLFTRGAQLGGSLVIKIASIRFAVIILALSALPAHADSETIGLLIGTIGAPHWARSSQQPSHDTLGPQSQQWSAFAYGDYAEGAGLPRNICGHVGGPKSGTWTCR
jgi:hypothetical protein